MKREQRRGFFAVIGGVALLVLLWPATTSTPAPVAPPAPPSAATRALLSDLARWTADEDRGFDLFGHRRLVGFGASRGFSLFADSPERRLLDTVPYGSLIVDAADRYRLDGLLLASVVEAESGFNAAAVSPHGARGLMQLMPMTAASFGAPAVADPRANVRAGARYLRYLLRTFDNDLEMALAAYNAGPAVVHRYRGIPPYRETREYVERVLTNYTRLHRQLWQQTEIEALLEDPAGTGAPLLAATPLQRSGLVGPLVFASRSGLADTAGVVGPVESLTEIADALAQPFAELRQARRAEQQHDDAEDDEQLRNAEISHGDLRGGVLVQDVAAPPSSKVSLAEGRGTPASPGGRHDLPVGALARRQTIARRGRGSV